MRKGMVAAVLAMLVAAMAGYFFDASNKEKQEEIEAGAKLYGQLCSACHGANGKGEGEYAGTALNNQEYLSVYSDENIENHIKFGRVEAKMPEYGSILEKEQIGQLAAYIRNWQEKELEFHIPASFEGDAGNGAGMYALYCANCHGRAGSGLGGAATALGHPEKWKHMTEKQMWLSIAYGRSETRMSASLEGREGVRQLSGQDINDIMAYIRRDLSKIYQPQEAKQVAGDQDGTNE